MLAAIALTRIQADVLAVVAMLTAISNALILVAKVLPSLSSLWTGHQVHEVQIQSNLRAVTNLRDQVVHQQRAVTNLRQTVEQTPAPEPAAVPPIILPDPKAGT